MLSVIPLTLLLFSFGAAVVPPNPDNRLPLLKGNPDRLHGVQKFVETGYCKKGRDVSQCILKGRNVNQNGWEICDTDKPCDKDESPCSVQYGSKFGGAKYVINVNCHLY